VPPSWVVLIGAGIDVVFSDDEHATRPRPCPVGASVCVRAWCQLPLLIMPAPTVTPVASSIRMNEPVLRFFA
jgi:hypothetical protein